MRRYEDVGGCLGDEPNDPALYRREARPITEPPTRAELAADDRDDWPRARYSDGAL